MKTPGMVCLDIRKASSPMNNSLNKRTSIIVPDETKSHSFVLKIWVKEPLDHDETPIWRGRITHVMEGSYKYVKTLNEIIQFLTPYFNSMGIKIDFDRNLSSE